MKKAFTLLELIFAILIIGIIASYAIPKYVDTRDTALASTIKRDIVTATTSIQSYSLVNKGITKISDALSLSTTNWTVDDKKAVFKESNSDCITLEIKTKDNTDILELTVNTDGGNVCTKLINNEGVVSTTFILY